MKLLPPVVSALAAFCLCWYLSAKRREAEAETSRRKPAAVSALPSPAPLFSAAAKNFPAATAAWHALPDGQLKARAAGALAVAASPEDKAAATALLDALSPADRKAADAQIADR